MTNVEGREAGAVNGNAMITGLVCFVSVEVEVARCWHDERGDGKEKRISQ